MEMTCENSGGPTQDPNGEPCTFGSYCDDCDIWAEADGVRYKDMTTLTMTPSYFTRYCCAQNCDTGEIEVSTSNGEVICNCYH